jgi:tRNA dimethylallyltransferase
LPTASPTAAQASPGSSDLTLHEQLAAVDPAMAERLHPNDVRKVARSLEIFREHGVPHSVILAQQRPTLRFGSVCCVWVECDQTLLDDRLDRRVDDMLTAGLLPELEAFHSRCSESGESASESESAAEPGRGIMQAIGFKEFAPYLAARVAGDPSAADALLSSCVDTMKLRTRQYARKQTRWVVNRLLAKAEPGLHALRVDSTDPAKWDETAAGPAARFVQSWLDGAPLVGNCGELVRPEAAEPWRKYECERCDRVLNGAHEWEVHLRSRQHRTKRKRGADERPHNRDGGGRSSSERQVLGTTGIHS